MLNSLISPTTISLGIALLGLVGLIILEARQRRWRDPVRFFTAEQKKTMRKQAGYRCEHKHPLWRRCPAPAEEADHIIPWSKGGATELWNGQYLCVRHNRRKSAKYPSAVYRMRLKRRRRMYAPANRPPAPRRYTRP